MKNVGQGLNCSSTSFSSDVSKYFVSGTLRAPGLYLYRKKTYKKTLLKDVLHINSANREDGEAENRH